MFEKLTLNFKFIMWYFLSEFHTYLITYVLRTWWKIKTISFVDIAIYFHYLTLSGEISCWSVYLKVRSTARKELRRIDDNDNADDNGDPNQSWWYYNHKGVFSVISETQNVVPPNNNGSLWSQTEDNSNS